MLRQVLSKIKEIYIRVWWVDVIYPLFLSISFLSGLSILIYSGQKHRSLASLMEESFIEFALYASSPYSSPQEDDKVAMITLREHDLVKIPYKIFGPFRDATVPVYAEIIKQLKNIPFKALYITWMPHWHDQGEDLSSLVDVLESLDKPLRDKIFFGIPPTYVPLLPQDFTRLAHVLESDPCQHNTQYICSYDKKWGQWVIQHLAERYLNMDESFRPRVLSEALPRLYPSYLVYLSGGPKDLSFSDFFFEKDPKKNLKDKIIFVGNDLEQGTSSMYKPEDIGKVKLPNIRERSSIRLFGAPFHKFWALLTQMFIDQQYIAIAAKATMWVFGALYALLSLIALFLFGVQLSLSLFIASSLLLPLANVVTIQLWRWYFPLFDVLYGSFCAFFIGLFLKISFESFHKWKAFHQQTVAREALDTKTNFLSLLSHNLNTPVAKLLNLLDLLPTFEPNVVHNPSLREAASLTTHIQLSIRFILVATALEEGQTNCEPITLELMRKEVSTLLMPICQRLGVDFSWHHLLSDPEEVFLPLSLDKKAWTWTIAAMIVVVLHSKTNGHNAQVKLECLSDGFKEGLKLQMTLTAGTGFTKESDLLFELSRNLIHSFVKCFHGEFHFDEQQVSLMIPAKSLRATLA